MAASYPGTLKTFLTHVNTTEVIDASHMNDVQAEIAAIQSTLGTNPHTSTAGAGSTLGPWSGASRAYLSLSDRLANIEAGHYADNKTHYVRFESTETITGTKTFAGSDTFFGSGAVGSATGRTVLRSGTTGGEASVQWRNGDTPRWTLYRLGGEAALYLRDMVNARQHLTYTPGATVAASMTTFHGSVTTDGNFTVTGTSAHTGNATFAGAVTVSGNLTVTGSVTSSGGYASGPPTASAVGHTASEGTATTIARSDHRHAREAYGNIPGLVDVGGAGLAGMELTVARGDHSHGLTVGAPAASAVADTASTGSATSVARSDHRHARESFGAATTSLTVGMAGITGTQQTPARSDHTHSMPASGTPGASAVGDAAAAGTATTVALSDHKHARENWGAAPPAVVLDASSAAGVAATPARSDHNHGLIAAMAGASAPGDVAAEGTATTVARSDHTHGREAAPTISSLGGVAKTGDTMTGALVTTYLAVQPQSGTDEGGEIQLRGSGSYVARYIDLFQNSVRIHDGAGMARFSVDFATGATTANGQLFEGANRVYSAANPPPSAAPAVPLAFHVGGQVGTGLRAPKFIAGVNMTLRRALSVMNAGSATYQIYVNGAAISGAAATANTTMNVHDFTDVNINAGDRVQLNVNSVSGADAAELSVTVDAVTR